MSMDQLMALVPIEAAHTISEKGRKSRWEKTKDRVGGSRWGAAEDKPYLPPPYVDLPQGMTPAQTDQFLREQRFDELSRKLATGELEFGDPDIRPPSPAPIYDKNGSRINTRDVRVRSAMNAEYQRLVEYMIKHVNGFTAPSDFKPSKKVRRIEIPLDKYPDYNFMGLIIGPRGCNHKRLESESGAQISIRGRGTQKEGKRTDHQTDEEASMPMHVHIAADSDEAVERAVSLVEPLLDPCHPMHEEFKKRGLEQLALVNGVTFGQLDQQRCASCGAVGHLAYDCPDAQQLQNFKKPELQCAICGDMGHVTMDCKLLPKNGNKAEGSSTAGLLGSVPPPPRAPPPKNPHLAYFEKLKMDQEYKKMMNELGGDFISKDNSDDSSQLSGQRKTEQKVTSSLSSNTPPPGVSPIVQQSASSPANSFSVPRLETPSNVGSPVPPPPPEEVRNNANNWEDQSTHREPSSGIRSPFIPGPAIRINGNARPGIGFPERARLFRGIPRPLIRNGMFLRNPMIPFPEHLVSAPMFMQHAPGYPGWGIGLNANAGISPMPGHLYLPQMQQFNHFSVDGRQNTQTEENGPPLPADAPPLPADAPPLPPGDSTGIELLNVTPGQAASWPMQMIGGLYDPTTVTAMQTMTNPLGIAGLRNMEPASASENKMFEFNDNSNMSPSGEAAMDVSN